MWLGYHAQSLAAREMPALFGMGLAMLEQFQPLLLPDAEIGLFRQAAQFPQPVENIAIGGMRLEPAFGKPP